VTAAQHLRDKLRISDLIRSIHTDGLQFVIGHGEEVAVVIDIAEYRRLRGGTADFKDFLRSAPDIDALEIDRPATPARVVDLDADA